jgi:hypothetical protein
MCVCAYNSRTLYLFCEATESRSTSCFWYMKSHFILFMCICVCRAHVKKGTMYYIQTRRTHKHAYIVVWSIAPQEYLLLIHPKAMIAVFVCVYVCVHAYQNRDAILVVWSYWKQEYVILISQEQCCHTSRSPQAHTCIHCCVKQSTAGVRNFDISRAMLSYFS